MAQGSFSQGGGERKSRSIAVVLTARTASFTKGLRAATRQLSKFGGVVGQIASKASALVTGALGALTAGFGVMATKISRLGEVSALAARKLGLPVEELRRLEAAAVRTGVGSRQLELGLQRMVRRVSEAARVGGPLAKVIGELGLNAKELNRLGPSEVFRRLGTAFAEVKNQGDRVRLAFKLFDIEGVNLVNTLSLGGERIEEIGRRLDQTGKTINSFEANQLHKLRNSFRDLGDVVEGVAVRMTVTLSEALEPVIDKFVDLAHEMDLSRKVAEGFKNVMATLAFATALAADEMLKIFAKLHIGISAIGVAFTKAFEIGAELLQGFTQELRRSVVSMLETAKIFVKDSAINQLFAFAPLPSGLKAAFRTGAIQSFGFDKAINAVKVLGAAGELTFDSLSKKARDFGKDLRESLESGLEGLRRLDEGESGFTRILSKFLESTFLASSPLLSEFDRQSRAGAAAKGARASIGANVITPGQALLTIRGTQDLELKKQTELLTSIDTTLTNSPLITGGTQGVSMGP